MISSSSRRRILLVGVVALALRLGYVLWLPQPPIVGDAGMYVELGQSLAEGRGFVGAIAGPEEAPTNMRMPLYPLQVAGVFRAGGGVVGVRVVQAVVGTVVVLGSYLIALQLAGPAVAITAAALTAVSVPLIVYTGVLQTETLFSLLVVLLAYAHQRFHAERSIGRAAVLGLASGLVSLCRAEMVVYPLVALVALGLAGRRTTILAGAVLLGTALLTLLPWTIRNAIVFDRFIPFTTQAGHVLWLATDPRDLSEWDRQEEPLRSALAESHNEQELSDRLLRVGLDNLRQHPIAYVGLSLRRFPRFWLAGHSQVITGLEISTSEAWRKRLWPVLLTKILFLAMNVGLIAVAFVAVVRARAAPAILPLVCLIAFKSVFHAATYADGRYHVPLLPLIYVLAALVLAPRLGIAPDHADAAGAGSA